jgi:hypothetical protein
MGLATKAHSKRFWDNFILNKSESDCVSTSISQTWTDQALRCYLSNADCSNCTIPKGNYSFDCQMYKVVPVLLSTLGEPEDNRVGKILPFLDAEPISEYQ